MRIRTGSMSQSISRPIVGSCLIHGHGEADLVKLLATESTSRNKKVMNAVLATKDHNDWR